jgi:ABC-type uncharacterized transport system fused permease/ATPase subunit
MPRTTPKRPRTSRPWDDSGVNDCDASFASLSVVTTQEQFLRPGLIKYVDLLDFMNHARLEMALKPNVNVITGRNGAGKSSVLQAIVLGLGK